MFNVTIINEGKKENITINQKQICSLKEINSAIEVRMSNGDIFQIIDPPPENWGEELYAEIDY